MRYFLNKFYLFCGFLSAITMVSMVMLVMAQIISRFFDSHIPSSDDISGYMVGWTTFLGLAYAMKHNDHIRVDLFINFLSAKLKFFFLVLVTSIGFLLISSFLYYVFLAVKESYDYGDLTSGLVPMPLWIIQTPFFFGIFALAISLLDQLISLLISGKEKKEEKKNLQTT